MHRTVVLTVVLGVILTFGCGEEYMTTDMESVANAGGFTLTLVASPDNINILAGGSVSILAEVMGPDGTGVEGAPILLSSTMGTLAETELTTDIDGFANTTLTPGSINGYAVVVATYKGIQTMVEVDFWTSGTGA